MYFGFSSLLKIRESKGDMHGIKGCRETHSLSHLLFVDDYLRDIFNTYEKALGQTINLCISEIFYSTNTSQALKQNISSLGVTNQLGRRKYLGLPSIIGRSKKCVKLHEG